MSWIAMTALIARIACNGMGVLTALFALIARAQHRSSARASRAQRVGSTQAARKQRPSTM
eukprot:8917123-Lingulodinium_polyedra.AAC.1